MDTMASAEGGMVKLETIVSSESIPRDERRNQFAVLVRVTAPPQFTHRHRLDLVAVLDDSGSMLSEGRLDFMKQAMMFVIDNLGTDDQLSILPFSYSVNENDDLYCPLTKMSKKYRKEVKTKVNALQTVWGADNDVKSAEKAAEILEDRSEYTKRSRIGRIIYLSDGEYTVDSEDVSSKYPVYTFGLSAAHSPKSLQVISDKSKGVYSYVNKNLEKMKDAFAQCIGGLTSVTAIDLKIKLKTHVGVSISAILSGGYDFTYENKEFTIHINDLYAGETKNFIVYLTVPERKNHLITVRGSYQDGKNDSIPLGESKVAVERPQASTASTMVVHSEVAGEVTRIMLVNRILNMEDKKFDKKKKLQRLWDRYKNSPNGLIAPRKTISNLDRAVTAMQGEVGGTLFFMWSWLMYQLRKQGEVGGKQFFMWSWLTSQQMQRATTKGSPCESGDFQTPAMRKMQLKADTQGPKPQPKSQQQPDKLKTMWQEVITWAKSNTCSFALPSVTLLLLPALLLIMYVVVGILTTKTATVIIEPRNTSSSPPDVSNHPGWSKMQKALEVKMVRSMGDVGITSLLNGVPVEDMRHATNRQLYLAIVHASLLGSRCRSEDDVATISQLEDKVKSLQAEKKHLDAQEKAVEVTMLRNMKDVGIASFYNDASVEDMWHATNRHLYLAIVHTRDLGNRCRSEDDVATISKLEKKVNSLEAEKKENKEELKRANTWIAELEKQLDDKKTLVGDGGAHHKNCGVCGDPACPRSQ